MEAPGNQTLNGSGTEMKRGHLSVDYEEGDQSIYRGIDVSIGEEKVRFDSGNITVDFINYIKWVADQHFDVIGYSSSWDHFFMDGEAYKGLHIDHSNENNVVENYGDPRFEDTIEYPVPLEINNFEELKAYYKAHKV
jgi:hypothetical protein